MARQMGYLMVDHRASPGLPEDVARWAGYDPKLAGEGKVYEVDTMSCSHCGGCRAEYVSHSSACQMLRMRQSRRPLHLRFV
jgi:hypothetical protein